MQARRIHLIYDTQNGAGQGGRFTPWNLAEGLNNYLDAGSIEAFFGEGNESLSSLDLAGEGDRDLTVEVINGPADITIEVAKLLDNAISTKFQ